MRTSVLAICLLFIFPGPCSESQIPGASDWILIRIDKIAPPVMPDDVVLKFRVVQELASCWIAKASRPDFELFLQMGGLGSILDEAPEGKTHYLFSNVRPEQVPLIEHLGYIIPIEDRIILFWSENEDFWDLIPEQVHVKALPSETSLRIAFEDDRSQSGLPSLLRAENVEAPDPVIAGMVAAVSKDALAATIQDLQNFQTRRISTSNCEAAGTYIYDQFAARGYTPEYDSFNYAYQGTLRTSRNIIASIQGETAPQQIIILGAHYDSTSTGPLALAPGADDDASGTAAIMEIARIMRDQPFNFSIRFICFSAEEIGLIGSRHYAQLTAAADESVIGMIQLDMIGYASRNGENLDVISNAPSSWLANVLLTAGATYTSLPTLKWILPSVVGSDHSSFWDQGYSAILAIENYPLVNPYYHKPTDTLATLDMDFETSVTKTVLAAAAALAQPVGTIRAPSTINARAETVRSLFRCFKNVFLTWDANDAKITGYNIYRSPVDRIEFQKINTAEVPSGGYVDRYLQPDAENYYTVTAVDSRGGESAYSAWIRQ